MLDDAAPGDWALGGAARWWLHGSLASLGTALGQHGAALVLRRGSAAEIIPRLVEETGADGVYAGRMPEPWARRVDETLAGSLGDRFRLFRTATLFDPDTIRTGSGGAYGVYTPFARACRARGDVGEVLPAPGRLRGAGPAASDRLEDWGLLPTHPDWAGGIRAAWTPGEDAARARLDGVRAGLARRLQDRAQLARRGQHQPALAAPALGRAVRAAGLARGGHPAARRGA